MPQQGKYGPEDEVQPSGQIPPAPQGNSGFFGPIQDVYDSAVAKPSAEDEQSVGHIGRAFANIGRGVMEGASPLFHPSQTLQTVADSFKPGHPSLGEQMVKGVRNDFKNNGVEDAIPHIAGNLMTAPLAEGAGDAVQAAGAPLERAGLGVVNNALGARGPKAFQWGQNAARGAIDEGVVPAMSKHSASMKLEPAMDRVGGQIANEITNSPATIPQRFLTDSIEGPIVAKRAVMNGPGGTKATAPLDTMQESMGEQAPGATSPIYGPATQLGPGSTASPSNVWRTVQNIDKNTRFNPDPEVEGMNEVRRSVRGGLSGNLKDAVPEVRQPMQSYSDLATARDSLDRTMHSGTSLKRFMDTGAFPAETAGGTGMVKLGRAMQTIDPRFLRAAPLATQLKEQ